MTWELMDGDFPRHQRYTGVCRVCPPLESTPVWLKGKVIELEGRDLVVIEVGHSDTDDTTCPYVPSVGLVVAGDVAYNDVHLYLAESNARTRRE